MIAVNAHSYGCSIRVNRGTCDFNHTVTRKIAEQRIIDVVRNDLLAPAAIELLKAEVRAMLKAEPDEAERIEKRRKALEKEIANCAQALAQIGVSPALVQRLRAAEHELADLVVPAPAPDFIPRLLDRYRTAIDDLRNVPHARTALADLLGQVPVMHDGNGLVAELGGIYSGVIARVASVKMVAGARFCSCRPIRVGLK